MQSRCSGVVRRKHKRQRVEPHLDESCYNLGDRYDHIQTSQDKKDANNRALKADPNKGRCLITGDKPAARFDDGGSKSLRLCHFLDAETPKAGLHQLTWAWGYKPQTLSLDTPKNRIILDANFHENLEHNRWLLMPSVEMVDLIYSHAVDSRNYDYKLPWSPERRADLRTVYGDRKHFDYYFIPDWKFHSTMSFSRLAQDGTESRHYYPFTDIGALKSHVPPHFVVFNTGLKLLGVGGHCFPDQIKDFYKEAAGLDEATATRTLFRVHCTLSIWLKLGIPADFIKCFGVTSKRKQGGDDGGGSSDGCK